jgi:2-keto-4-pentenoate hydratase/2-oxohepta-3-ene-1,7-dioic acid hydratase in catechol pathway
MKFCNLSYGSAIVAGVLLDEGVAPLFQLIPEIEGVSHPDSGRPMAMGATVNGVNNLVHLSDWQNAVSEVDDQILRMTEKVQVDEVKFAPPVLQPNSFRDFYAFEEHVRVARSRRGLEVVPEWYEIPVFYFSNHRSFITHGDSLVFPQGGEWLDYELEVAAVINRQAENLSLEQAESCIAGYCLLNDWSLRDTQRREMAVGLGPAKGKDFASGLGPWLVTPDELSGKKEGQGLRPGNDRTYQRHTVQQR